MFQALTRSLKDASQELQKQNLELRQSLVNLERTRQVEVKAYAGVELHLTELQNRILSLEEEVAFYRGIVSSTGKRGVSVQRLFMFPRLEAGKFRFQVVLTRDMKSDKVQKGTLSLSVAGEQNGESRKLSAAKLFGTNGSELEFSFRFFQRLEGEISLPLEFVPRRVHVKIKAPGEVPASAERTFDWVVTSG